jgi:hypothetical protein
VQRRPRRPAPTSFRFSWEGADELAGVRGDESVGEFWDKNFRDGVELF